MLLGSNKTPLYLVALTEQKPITLTHFYFENYNSVHDFSMDNKLTLFLRVVVSPIF